MISRCTSLAFALMLSVWLAATGGCGGGGSDTPAAVSATVSGTVLDDATLQPVEGAVVSVGNDSTTTSADGSFSLRTTAGSKTIQISRAGYQSLSINRQLLAGSNAIGMLYLRPSLQPGAGAASGTVRYRGAPVVGAQVRSGGSEATTRADGSFTIYNLPAGERGLLAFDPNTSRVGYAVVNVVAGQTTSGANILLNLEPPARPTF